MMEFNLSCAFDWNGAKHSVNIIQGEYKVSADPTVIICTVLGSCVSACITDRVTGLGGMNHFLLPGTGRGQRSGVNPELYGVTLMRRLIDRLLQRGARRENLEAQLFGGACTLGINGDVGALNADFAEAYLAEERIRIVGGSIGGAKARKLQFAPVHGDVREYLLDSNLIQRQQLACA